MIVKPKSIPESIPDAEHVSARLREPRRPGRKTFSHRALLLAGLALLMSAFGAHAASVGPAGYTNDFGSQPAAVDFSGGNIAGASGDVTDAAGMDAAVATVSAANINLQLALVTGTPPTSLGEGVYNDTGKNLQLRPTNVKVGLILVTLTNNAGGNATNVLLSYSLIQSALAAEQVNGVRVYYSLTGSAGSWTHVPAWSATAAGLVNTNVTLTAPWNVNAPLYLLFADENGSPSPDTANQIDNFSIIPTVIGGVNAVTLSTPANGSSASAPAVINLTASAGAAPGATVSRVAYYYTNSGAVTFVGSSAAGTTYPVSTASLGVGSYGFYAVMTNSLGAITNSLTNVVSVVATLTNLTFLQQPTNAGASVVVAPEIRVSATNSLGAAMVGIPVTLSLTGSGTLGGTLTQNTDGSGIAHFANLTVDVNGVKTLIATNAGSGISRTSSSFTITNGPTALNSLTFLQQPTDALVGAIISPEVRVGATNGAGGAMVGLPVTLSLNGIGTLGGAVTQNTDGSGLAHFANLTVSVTGLKTLIATNAASGVSGTSASFSITNSTSAIVVGALGSGVQTFTTLPLVSQWSTYSYPGAVNATRTDAEWTSFVNSNSAGNITAVLDTKSASGTGGNAYWRSDLGRIATQPTGNAGTLLMATLINSAGYPLTALNVTYEMSDTVTGLAEAHKGHRLYYSTTGLTNGWTFFGSITNSEANTKTISLTLSSLGWAPNSLLYLLWADENGISPDGDWSIDNINFVPGGPAPTTITITSPTNTQNFAAGVAITVDATVTGSVTNVSFYADGGFTGRDTNSPFSLVYSNAAFGPHTLTAVATDTNGASVTSAVVNITNILVTPTIVITAPTNTQTFLVGTSITINVTATAAVVTNVSFFADGVLIGHDPGSPFSLAYSNASVGTHALTAVVQDNVGQQTTSGPVNITVVNNFVPVVSLTSPLDGTSYFKGTNLTLTATASDANGTVTSVEFRANGLLLGTDFFSPFTFAWNNIPEGIYVLTAVATDNVGARATSAPVQVNVLINPDLLIGRQYHTATLLPNGRLLVTGGQGDNGDLAGAQTYDSSTGKWATAGGLNTARYFHTATLLPNGKVLVAGGFNSTNNADLSSAELYDPATGVWTVTGPMGAARSQHTATLLPNGKVLVAGGSSLASVEVYDPATGTWTATGAFSTARYQHTATLLPNGKVLVTGGQDNGGSALSSVEIYDPATGTWTATGALTIGRNRHTATLLANGKVLVVAGQGSGGTLTIAELYDPAAGTWTVNSELATARHGHTATLLSNGKLLIMGGNNGAILSSMELYNPATGTWAATSALSTGRYRHTATLLANGQVLAVGGNNGGILSSVDFHDSAVGTWSAMGGALITPRENHTGTLLPDGKVLVAGGYNGSILSSAELFNPATGKWTVTGPLNLARIYHTATLLLDGKVLVAGGSDSISPLASAELYDPGTGTWTLVGAMSIYRSGHTATLLSNGKVLVAGGQNPIATVYDPVTGTWAETGSLNHARTGHTATLLPNGKVLVVGGTGDGGSSFLSSAELYDPVLGTWTETGALITHRSDHTSTLLPDGQLLAAGGYHRDSGPFDYLSSAERYDPATGTWSADGSLNTRRSQHTATLLPNGKVLLAGGVNTNGLLAASELYIPARGMWAVTGSLDDGRSRHTATLLPGGNVLLVGGHVGSVAVSGTRSYDVGLGFSSSGQPQITTFSTLLVSGGSLSLTGARFRGISGGSGGNVQDSPGDNPVVQLRSLENGQTVFLRAADWSTNSYLSAPVTGLPSGWTMATMFVNGIPSPGILTLFTNFVAPIAVTITSPTNTQNFFVGADISVEATASTSVSNVSFFSNGGLLGNVTNSPYRLIYRNATEGDHTLLAVATGPNGLSVTSSPVNITVVTNPSLSVYLTNPSDGASVSLAVNSSITLSAAVFTNLSPVTTVEFYEGATLLGTDSTSPFSLVWSNLSAGAHALRAVAVDAGGTRATSAPVNLTLATNLAPLVSLVSPVDETSFPGPTDLVLTGTASDTDGTVASVEFYAGSVLLGTANLSPFTVAWSNVPDGSYVLTAVATDNLGLRSTSAPVQISVVINSDSLIARQFHTATLLTPGTVLAVGGQGVSGDLASAQWYDPATGKWKVTGRLNTARHFHTATLLPTGKVLVAGGVNGTSGSDLSSAELFDPATGAWATTSAMSAARSQHTATVLPNGKVLIAGGDGSGSLASAELFDPATGTWTSAGTFSTARFQHTATLLPNGKVLVAGGQDYGGTPLTSVAIYDPAGGTWTTTNALNTARRRHTATLLPSGKVLIAGGEGSSGALDTVELFDPAAGTWTMSVIFGSARSRHTATLLPNGKMVFMGGSNGGILSSAEFYNPATGTWAGGITLGTPRYCHTSTLLPNGQVLMAGGNNGNILSSVELYDSAAGFQTAAGAMNSAHGILHASTLLPNGKLLVTGGYNGSDLASADLYDPAAGVWTATSDMSVSRREHGMTLLTSGTVLVTGGYNPVADGSIPSVEVYNPATGIWTGTPNMNTARSSHTSTLLPDGKVLVVGGEAGGVSLTSAELYNPTTGTWTTTGSLGVGRQRHTATLLPNGKVLIAGGYRYNTGQLFSAELYDPATGVWTSTGALGAKRWEHTATLLPDGKVLVAGGEGSSGKLSSAELYDPVRGTWAATGPMSATRYHHSATLLLNGRVLVAGGIVGGVASATAELYDPSSGLWKATGTIGTAREWHTARLLPNGKVVFAGGKNASVYFSSAQLYDAGLGFNSAWQPQITTYPASLLADSALTLTGTLFRGISSGSGGNTQDSPGDNPVVRLQSLENGQTVFLRSTNWSTNACTTTAVSGVPPGWIMATLFVNGIPSPGVIMSLASAGPGRLVGSAGDTNSFLTELVASHWATLSIAGSASDNYLADVEVNTNINLSAAAFTTPPTPDAGNPPASSAIATWSSTGQYLQTRPIGNKYTALMGKFVNNTGTNATQVTISYLRTIVAGSTEDEGLGTRVYYSLSGLTNSWTNLAALNTTSSTSGSQSVATNLALSWPDGGSLYFLWVDDNASASADGAHQIDNFFLGVTAVNTLSVSLTAPTNGQIFGFGSSLVMAATANPVATVTNVAFFDGATLLGTDASNPFSLSWPSASAGVHTLTAVATDTLGRSSTSAPVNIQVVANFAPTISLTNPPGNVTVIAPASLTIGAVAFDSDGSVTNVEFFDGPTLLGADSTSPYSYFWSSIPLGPHQIVAVATDNYGARGTSAPVQVNVVINPDLLIARQYHTATLLPNGKLLVAGGQGDNGDLAGAQLYDSSTGKWAPAGGLNTARYFHTATLLPNGRVLVAGGFNSTNNADLASAELYDPATGLWTAANAMNGARSQHTATLLPSGKVLVAGGYGGGSLTSAELYDPVTGTWSAAGAFSTACYQHTATLLPNGKVLIAGGQDNGGSALASSQIYDPATGTWTTTGALIIGRNRHTATLLPSGKVLIVAGQGSGGALNTAELYDPAAGTWTVTGGLGTARNRHTATLLPNGKLLVMGGNNGGVLSSAELYDPAAGTWAATTALSTARHRHTATLLPNGKVLAVGGNNGAILSSVEVHDPAVGTWTATGAMITARYRHTATLLPNGKVVVAGGQGNGYVWLSSSEVYDPALGTWSASGALAGPRSWHTATLLSDGTVLVAGGSDDVFSYPSRTELYNPAIGTWTVTGALNSGRGGHAATLLANGKVLVTGGLGNSGQTYLSSAELYDPALRTWTVTGAMGTPRRNHTATLMPNGKVLVMGGENVCCPLSSAELYDPVTGTWTATGPTEDGNTRNGHSATLLPNGKVLVAGTDSFALPRNAQIFDPATGLWTASAPLSANLHSATLLPNGKVLIAGKSSNSGYFPTAQLYDPASGSWTTISPMSIAHVDHTATLLPNGKVLVAGGINNSVFFSSAELFDPGLGFSSSWQPQVATFPALLVSSGSLSLTGTRFRGVSGGSGGTVQDSPGDFPVVQLLRLDNEQVIFPHAASWSANSYISAPVTGMPSGWVMATMFVNGIPSPGILTYFTNFVGPIGVAITSPTNNQNFLPGVNITVDAIASTSVSNVSFFFNGGLLGNVTSSPFSLVYSNAIEGVHTLLAVADGTNGLSITSAPVQITVASNFKPLVSLTNPLNGTSFSSPTNLTLGATASDPDGTVTNVQFYANGALLGTDFFSPFTFAWNNIPEGLHVLTAVATDNVGARGTSAPVQVNVLINPDLLIGRQDHTATLLPNGRLLVTGGQGDNGDLAGAQTYDSSTGKWATAGGLNTARYFHTATLLPNGRVLVAGGFNSTNNADLASAELYDPATGLWTVTAPMGTARSQHTATLLPNGKVLVAGGYGGGSLASVELYDPATGTWTATGAFITGRYQHTATLLPNGKVLVAGGQDNGGSALASSQIYDPATGTWTTTGALIIGRNRHTATLLANGKVLAVAGEGASGALNIAELYDPATGTWTVNSLLGTVRNRHTATLLPNGKLLVMGGDNGSILSTAELYNPATGTWTTSALSTGRYRHTATLLANGQVLAVGGNNVGILSSVERYDSASGSWAATGTMGATRDHHTSTLLPSGKVLVIGGATFASAELFDATTGTWTATGLMSATRDYHTATLLPNGKVLVAGGDNGSGGPLSSTEVYDPAAGTWTGTGPMNSGRIRHTATLLANGKVLVAGGYINNFGSLVSAEIYDPATGIWTVTGAMNFGRSEHTATLLPNGKVLVAGGYFKGGGPVSTVELYDPATGTWTATGALSVGRYGHTATLLHDGRVLVAAGRTDGFSFSSAEVYDSSTGTWTATGSLNAARDYYTATLLPNGKVLAASGKINNGPYLTSTELYDPATGTWTLTGAMGFARNRHTATLLANGKVLIAGGNGGSGSSTSAELFEPGLGFSSSWQPQLATVPPLLLGGHALALTGTRFRGISGGSGGNAQDSPGDNPVVQLRSLENGRTVFLHSTNWSTNAYTSAPVGGLPDGWIMATMFVNGIPSPGFITSYAIPVAPSVTISDPTNTQNFSLGSSITLAAVANGNGPAVTNVAFYDGASLLGIVTSTPFTITWSNAALGAHLLTAVAQNGHGLATTSAPVNITVNPNTAPTVSISNPLNNAIVAVPGNITIEASAFDSDGIVTSVEFYNGPALLGTDNTSPHSFFWSAIPVGTYQIFAVAVDAAGGRGTSAPVNLTVVTNLSPLVTLTNPVDGTIFPTAANLTLAATASDADGFVTTVEFFTNGALLGTVSGSPFNFAWSNLPQGIYVLTAVATDNVGLRATSAPVTITVVEAGVPVGASGAGPFGFETQPTVADGWTTANLAGSATDLSTAAAVDAAIRAVSAANVSQTLPADGTLPPVLHSLDQWNSDGLFLQSRPTSTRLNLLMATLRNTAGFDVASFDVSYTFGELLGNPSEQVPGLRAFYSLTGVPNTWQAIPTLTTGTTGALTATLNVTNWPAGSVLYLLWGDDNGDNTSGTEGAYTIDDFAISNVVAFVPTVAITSPTNAQNFTVGFDITVNASPAGPLTKVNFFADGVLLGSATTSPFSLVYSNATEGVHVLLAVASGSNGLSVTSAPVNITVNPDAAPAVSITSPEDGSIFAVSENVAISASAFDADGAVGSVEFYAGLNLLGTDNTSPYSITWSNVPLGTHAISAVALDNTGQRATSAVVNITIVLPGILVELSGAAATPFATAPTVAAGWTTGNLPGTSGDATTAASVDAAIRKVAAVDVSQTLPPDGTLPPPFSGLFQWNSDGLFIQSRPTGTKINLLMATLRNNTGTNVASFAVAYDFAEVLGNASEQVPGLRAFYSLTGASNTWVAVPALSTGTAGALTATLNVTNWPAGNALYLLWGDDNSTGTEGAYTIDNFAISNVLPAMPPSVLLASPTNSQTFFLGSSITLSATATGHLATVTNVAFFDGASLLGTDATNPFTLVWNSAAVGVHALTAVATDNLGLSSTSAVVNIQVVANLAPTISLTNPPGNLTLAAFGNFTLGAIASDSDGSVANVEFYNGLSLLGADSTSPYSYAWSNIPIGTHQIFAVAVDNYGLRATSAVVSVTAQGPGIPVGLSGAGPFGFGTPPTVQNGWSTTNLPGGSSDVTTAAQLDAAIQNVAAANVFAALPADGTVPPAGFTLARWNSAGFYLQSRANGVKALLLMATLRNNVGADVTSFTVSYDFGDLSGQAEQVPGLRVFYSLTGASNTWQAVPGLTTGTTGALTATLSVGTWPAGSAMYLLWGDDNASTTDGAYTIDNFAIANVRPTIPLPSLTEPTNGATYELSPAPGITLSAIVTNNPGAVTKVEFYRGETLLGSDSSSPYSMVWNNPPAGACTLRAVAVDFAGGRGTSAPVQISVTMSPPVLDARQLTNGVFQLSLSGQIGQAYAIDRSPDLLNWTEWMVFTNQASQTQLQDPGATNTAVRFYRGRHVPQP